MKALTVKQPWAWAIISGRKRVENRTWSTSVRGRIAIHSSKKHEDDWRRLAAMLEDDAAWNACSESPAGAILGTVELVDCVEESDDYSFTTTSEIRDATLRKLKCFLEEDHSRIETYLQCMAFDPAVPR